MKDVCTGGICRKIEGEKFLGIFCKPKVQIQMEDQIENWRMLRWYRGCLLWGHTMEVLVRNRPWHSLKYYRNNSTKTPASGAGNVSDPRLMSQVGRLREVVRSWIGVLILARLRSSRNNVTEVGEPSVWWDWRRLLWCKMTGRERRSFGFLCSK